MNVEVIPEPICGCDTDLAAMPHNEAMAFVDKELKRRNDERLAESIAQAERGEFVEVEL